MFYCKQPSGSPRLNGTDAGNAAKGGGPFHAGTTSAAKRLADGRQKGETGLIGAESYGFATGAQTPAVRPFRFGTEHTPHAAALLARV